MHDWLLQMYSFSPIFPPFFSSHSMHICPIHGLILLYKHFLISSVTWLIGTPLGLDSCIASSFPHSSPSYIRLCFSFLPLYFMLWLYHSLFIGFKLVYTRLIGLVYQLGSNLALSATSYAKLHLVGHRSCTLLSFQPALSLSHQVCKFWTFIFRFH